MFNKDEFFKYDDMVIEKVEVPEWGKMGKHIYVRTMSGTARDNFEIAIGNAVNDEAKDYNVRASMAVACCCDKDGKLLFIKSDVEAVGKKSCAGLDRIYDVAKRLSRVRAEDVKEMEKTLEANRS
jgi:hypothetical protein